MLVCTLYTPIHLYTPLGVYTPIGPHALLCTCMVLEHLHVVGVVICLNVFWDSSLTPPLFGGASPFITPPTLHCWFPLHCYSQGYQFLMWAFPLLLKGLGVFPPSLREVGVTHQLSSCSTCSFCVHHFFVVHYVSHVSTTAPTTTPPITVVSSGLSSVSSVISGSFSYRVSSKPWCGSTTTLDAEELWRCFWLRFYAAAADSIFNAYPLAYANYAMGSPQVGFFFFQSWASHHHCILYMFGVCSGVCFLLLGAKLDAVFTYGGSTVRVCTLATLLECTHGRHMCNLVMVISPHLVCIEWLLPLLL